MQEWKYREEIGKQGKFRVGDLIQLSAYGLKSEQNINIHFDGEEMGIVIKIDLYHTNSKHRKYPIIIQWINIPMKNSASSFFFRELKLKRT
tara:strand:- start:823 stop:1095 length:273 start_codon:yes stop_codon:yes gene_type:complete